MLIQGNAKTNKTQFLIEKYVELINQGINSDEILVICLNSYKRQLFVEAVKEKLEECTLDKLNIYTFYGLCYNAFLDNWPLIEEKIKNENPSIIPNLCGLELSQYLLKQSVRNSGFKDYGSKINLLHQLFRRFSLITQNCLDNNEVKKRANILKETFYEDTKQAIDDYRTQTLNYRSFDYLRQLSIFPYICEISKYFNDVKYLIVDDSDEITYLEFEFIKYLKPQLTDYFIAYDKDGSSRFGYLSAYKNAPEELEKLFQEKPVQLTEKSLIAKEAQTLYENIINGKKTRPDFISFSDSVKRLDMIDAACEKIKELQKKGVKPGEITLITPVIDDVLKYTVEENFATHNIDYQIISGSEKLIEHSVIKNTFIILKLSNPSWNLKVEPYEIRGLFINLLKIPVKYSLNSIQTYKNTGRLEKTDFYNNNYEEKYSKILSIIAKIKENKYSLPEQLLLIFENLLYENIKSQDINNFSFLLKEIESFYKAFPKIDSGMERDFIIQLENTVISENPSPATELKKNSVIISTPQKIIDFKIKTKYQIWLDISNREWQKQDIGPLYNSWVFYIDWNKDSFTFEDNLRLIKEKNARILRKLVLCANKEIFAYSSLYDSLGNENFGGISDYFELRAKQTVKKSVNFEPRDDQKPVLEYTKGKMGIMAVPGAGKTTILIALIAKLLGNKIKAENIFVLTYMESAARNLKERLKTSYPQFIELPNISTIHGLALRIIKENANYIKLGLTDGFEICDDNERQKVIRETLSKINLSQDNYENYEKAISSLKLSTEKFPLHSKYKEINDFINFYNLYNKALQDNNLIDYDDMLSLSVKLLQENPDILFYYQTICLYIIEDEAQDSSAMQQKLLSLLSGKSENIIRCGDVNQSITSTFTNSDIKNFKDFLAKNNKVEMKSSQRCAKPIYSLANNFIEYACNIPEYKNTFYKIDMLPTKNNPHTDKKIIKNVFEKDTQEKEFIIKEIKSILTNSPKSNIAILSRNNYQVNEYSKFLTSSGLKALTRSDYLNQKSVFKLIFSILKIIDKPWNNKEILESAKILNEFNIIKFDAANQDFINELKIPFINLNPDDIENSSLSQFHWDINYWLNNSYLSLEDLAIKIGLYYFNTPVEKSNVYLLSTLIKRLSLMYKSTQTVMEKLEDLSGRPISSTYKFFESEDENKTAENAIQIMTVHKSKGDEFDVVFIPEITEDNYSLDIEKFKVKANTHFIETVKNLNPKYTKKSEQELKISHIEESLRLLYVGFTRAKKELYLTSSQSYKKRKSSKPSVIFENFLEKINE